MNCFRLYLLSCQLNNNNHRYQYKQTLTNTDKYNKYSKIGMGQYHNLNFEIRYAIDTIISNYRDIDIDV